MERKIVFLKKSEQQIFYRVDENKVYIDRILNSKTDYVKEFIKEL